MGLFDKFKKGLGKSSDGLSTGFKNIFSKKKIDENVLTEFEEGSLNIKMDTDLNILMRGPVSEIKHTKLEI